MVNQTLITGKIAKVQDKYRVVINRGRLDGVKPGMRFYVYEEGEEITDPDTGEFIEKQEIRKGYLKTTHVQDKISILQSDEKETVIVTPPTFVLPNVSALNHIFGETREVMKPLSVNSDENSDSDSDDIEKKREFNKKISRGDLVKQVPTDF